MDDDPCKELRKSTVELSNAYIRIREMLNAFNTSHGGADRFEVTERKLMELITERDMLRERIRMIKDAANVREY